MVSEKDPSEPKDLSFKYIFPDDLKELHVNGAYGGLAPDGTIRMGVYSERRAIPNFERRSINPDMTLGPALEEDTKYTMVRIVQASLVFSVSTAKSFVTWLNDHIKQAEKFKEELSKTSGKGGNE